MSNTQRAHATPEQARELKEAGLDYYNHNLDTSENHYGRPIAICSES